MNLQALAAAFKAKWRPVFDGGLERELIAMEQTAERIGMGSRNLAAKSGIDRALHGITEGKGE